LNVNHSVDRSLILITSLVLDLLWDDPPNQVHPVAWMGTLIAAAQRRSPQSGATRQFLYGGLITLGGLLGTAGIGYVLERLAESLPRPFNWLLGALLLKVSFSLRGLTQAAVAVQRELSNDNLPEARRLAGWHLVSRDTSTLNEAQVAAAAIESVAENASDGITAPLFYYVLLGLPGALAYRFANTADAMLGYRDSAREWLGKIPARFDDLLNLLPARLTALLWIMCAPLIGADSTGALTVWRTDRSKTASPNAGHPMSAAAGALEVRLEKTDHYVLGERYRAPGPTDIKRAVHLMQIASLAGFGLAVIVLSFRKRQQRDEQ
jgi:adenosylcobinamide-phosphate synthase